MEGKSLLPVQEPPGAALRQRRVLHVEKF